MFRKRRIKRELARKEKQLITYLHIYKNSCATFTYGDIPALATKLRKEIELLNDELKNKATR